MYRNILIPTDGSPLSRAAVRAGIRLAKSTGAKVTGFFAAPPATPIVYQELLPVGYMTTREHANAIKTASRRYLGMIEDAARKAGVRYKGVCVTSDFPADAILACAKKEKCDLIFIASHGRRGLAGVILGSETQKVLAHATTPILVHR